ncbi:MAG: hypothetical protein GY804_11625 [Alphaproteobacteria bacterium]|nr:hypothetical protein [Alphaproteobacteria bacterium]
MSTLEEKLAQYKEKKNALAPFLNELKVLEHEIKTQVLKNDTPISVEGVGSVTIRNGYIRASWNGTGRDWMGTR